MAKGLPKLVIYGDPERANAASACREFMEFCQGKAEILANCFESQDTGKVLKKADFAVVFGGDGTMLEASREISETGVPVIGVNVGKLGYLAEFSIDEIRRLFDRITSDESLIDSRMLLECSFLRDGKPELIGTAVNDIVINAGPPFRMIELQMSIQGNPLAACVGDGLIISTPTGSTAYNLSSGGPILSANLSAMVITPICPHSLSFRPIVVGAEAKIEVFAVRVNKGTTVTLDGQVCRCFKRGDVIGVERHPASLRVVSNPTRTQWDTLAGKLNWAGRPNYRIGGDQSHGR